MGNLEVRIWATIEPQIHAIAGHPDNLTSLLIRPLFYRPIFSFLLSPMATVQYMPRPPWYHQISPYVMKCHHAELKDFGDHNFMTFDDSTSWLITTFQQMYLHKNSSKMFDFNMVTFGDMSWLIMMLNHHVMINHDISPSNWEGHLPQSCPD